MAESSPTPRRMRFAALACVAFGFASTQALAVVKPRAIDPEDHHFPRPAVVRKQVRFWQKVFYKYPSTTVIVHESDDTDRIIDIIDYRLFSGRENRNEPVPRKEREEVTSRYLKRYNKALERFASEGERATRHGAIEKRLLTVYGKNDDSRARLLSGELKIRAQTGLADDFVRSAAVAQQYLPYMEQVFKQYGVPARLTRLAFVESMFNLKARSKVGASGIWQFMPDTARNFIYVTSLVDERNNPFKATRAAAQFLFNNHRDLGAWPLAVTAYNHGKLGMERATKQVRSRDIGAIIENYESKSFGFASKNFYSEFIAAADVYERLVREGRITQKNPLPDLEAMVIQTPLSVDQIVKHTPLTKELLQEHNPCILDSTFQGNSHRTLPAYFELRIPRALAQAVKASMQNIGKKKVARR